MTSRLRKVGVLALAIAAVSLLSADRAMSAACPLVKTCAAGGMSTLGPVDVDLTGTGMADVQGTSLAWHEVNMVGEDASLGRLNVVLDPTSSSTGTLSSATLPATNTNSFRFMIDSQNLGWLMSSSPVVLQATINSIPPRATYTMTGGPVAFFVKGDPGQTTVFTLTSATVSVAPGSVIPTLSEWGMILLVTVLLATGMLLVLRRRRMAGAV